MSPADVYFGWMSPSTGGALLSHRHNGGGYDPPSLAGGAGAALLSGTRGSGSTTRTNVTFTRPLRTGVTTEAQFTPGAPLSFRRKRARARAMPACADASFVP
jgi:hypothetical protein